MAAEVTIEDVAPGQMTVRVDGVTIPSVMHARVSKQPGGPDLVTLEIVSQRTTVTPVPITTGLEEIEARDAEIDARIAAGGTVGA